MKKTDGGPAFPSVESVTEGSSGDYREVIQSVGGMRLRDYFAAKAMPMIYSQACLDESWKQEDKWIECIAMDSYRMADAMLAEREK